MNMRLDRHSGTGMRGLPKKNGAGAKTVWGPAVDDQVPMAYLDKNDPNYDSDEEHAAPVDFPPLGDMKASAVETKVAAGDNDRNDHSEEDDTNNNNNTGSSSAESSPSNSSSPLVSPEATD